MPEFYQPPFMVGIIFVVIGSHMDNRQMVEIPVPKVCAVRESSGAHFSGRTRAPFDRDSKATTDRTKRLAVRNLLARDPKIVSFRRTSMRTPWTIEAQ